MKYEPNIWHGWNGGECPVHPKTVVEVAMRKRGVAEEAAEHLFWEGDRCRFVAFRVVKEYMEPREFWVWVDTSGSVHISKMQIPCSFKVREVIK